MDDYFNNMVEVAIHDYKNCTPKELRRQIKSVLQEVERDKRHKAGDLTYELANEIQNMKLEV